MNEIPVKMPKIIVNNFNLGDKFNYLRTPCEIIEKTNDYVVAKPIEDDGSVVIKITAR